MYTPSVFHASRGRLARPRVHSFTRKDRRGDKKLQTCAGLIRRPLHAGAVGKKESRAARFFILRPDTAESRRRVFSLSRRGLSREEDATEPFIFYAAGCTARGLPYFFAERALVVHFARRKKYTRPKDTGAYSRARAVFWNLNFHRHDDASSSGPSARFRARGESRGRQFLPLRRLDRYREKR